MQAPNDGSKRRAPEGIVVKHRAGCPAAAVNGDRCRCKPAYQANVWDPAALDSNGNAGKRVRKTFPTLGAAKAWRNDALAQLGHGTTVAPSTLTLRAAAEQWLAGVRDGAIRNRSGDAYKPSAIRSYDRALKLRVLPSLGAHKLSDVRRGDLQRLVERLQSDGLDPSTIRNTLMPLRAIYRRALNLGDVHINPTAGLQLPAVRGKRDRIAGPAEAAALLAALPADDRALWATAMYAGLRRGELRALGWQHVDLAAGVIRVERALDDGGAFIEPKSHAGRRTVPIPAVLRDELVEHRMRQGRDGTGLVFGRDDERPFEPGAVSDRAKRAWSAANDRTAEAAAREQRDPSPDELLTPIGLHECRHTFASLMIAAGVNAKALSTFMGHASITITLDRYGHLMPGSETEAAGLLDAYLHRANTAARLAQLDDAAAPAS
jgi:integrase